ncbi:hypothetical protein EN875_034010 [Mesorhizobium sp. M2D.F.Ca.ET.232.01.1.1]|uniref:hypothetical protein n=1 Tax=Mesorhizobium sp. M2D.F.Ca.ET.232.01.1.1 TaxID=2496670 RepID=UPI000FCAD4A7|nr:hypothetical protein [Mesorhizobium sp. M2D.F.Ca.ET.232.01.1.1]TGP27357.1 hypothetical protein EN875_034010 [Mesorhizobium sp. M2D.F.Ca.ET.232.01.1.1]
MRPDIPSPLDFFGRLRWLNGKPLLDTMEPYRREFMTTALYSFTDDGLPLFNLVLSGRGKKNFKTTDLVLASLYRLLIWPSDHGNDCFILANDEGQAGDDLALAKKLIDANARELGGEVEKLAKEIRRCDGRGSLQILPGRDVTGAHGKTALFIGFDEIHGVRSWDIFEALAPDPTRTDVLTWIASYDTIYNVQGVPLHDLKQIGKAGTDPRMLFSWYSGELCTDPNFAELPPRERANPSMKSWPEGEAYLDQQQRRLPTHKYRRLHLNMPGAPDGAFLNADKVLGAVRSGVNVLKPQPDRIYKAFVDMSGGSSDDATLAIAHNDDGKAVVDLVMKQAGSPPFSPRAAVKRFARVLKEYGLRKVTGDAYAGLTYRQDFEEEGIEYQLSGKTKTQLYEALEPRLNAGEVELPDEPKMQEQLLTLVTRGARIDHQPGDHDDWANAAAGAIDLVATPEKRAPVPYSVPMCGPGGPNVSQYSVPGYRSDPYSQIDAVLDAAAAERRDRERAYQQYLERNRR